MSPAVLLRIARRLVEAVVTLGIAAASVWHLGCTVTDYHTTALEPALGKSHGLTTCLSDERFANSQQTIELHTRELLYRFEPGASSGCGGAPLSTTDLPVSRQDAREWNRFLGAYAELYQFTIEGSFPAEGTYIGAGVKDMLDGSRRVNNFFLPLRDGLPSPRPCVITGEGGRDGGPEGAFFADRHVQPGELAARIPEMRLDAVVIDSQPGNQWCENIVAMHPDSYLETWTIFTAVPTRRAEWRLHQTPITRRAAFNMARLLVGGDVTVHWQGIDVTVEAERLEEGEVAVHLLTLESEKSRYVAESPLSFVLDPSNGMHAVSLDLTGKGDELRRLAQFVLDNELAGREIELGQTLPEIAVRLPEISIFLPEHGLQRIASGELQVARPAPELSAQ